MLCNGWGVLHSASNKNAYLATACLYTSFAVSHARAQRMGSREKQVEAGRTARWHMSRIQHSAAAAAEQRLLLIGQLQGV